MQFYDKKRPCPKCGKIGASTNYDDGWPTQKHLDTYGYPPKDFIAKETMTRKCQNCHYSWDEIPLQNSL